MRHSLTALVAAALIGGGGLAVLAPVVPTGTAHAAQPVQTVQTVQTVQAAGLQVTTQQTRVDDRGRITLTVRCAQAKRCAARLRVAVDGRQGSWQRVGVPARKQKKVRVTLSARQFAGVDADLPNPAKVQLKQGGRATTATVRITRTAPLSEAYVNRNWTPTAADTCSAALHRSYSTIGPDGKRYPTWHPPTVTDPVTGQTCTFGHEHGQDPAKSDIYDWVTAFLQGPGGERQRGLPFGYVSEASMPHEGHDPVVMRHEDNVGHKVFVANNVKLVTKSPRGYLMTEVDGQPVPVECDYLMKLHQGSHSADAFKNNAHELTYAVRCNDGTELITSTLTRFGNANEFNRACEPAVVVPTSGSDLPDGPGGQRLIPDRTCVDRYVLVPGTARSDLWGVYEVWQSLGRISDHDGTVLAQFDPWFGVRNPSRYFDPAVEGGSAPTLGTRWLTDAADGGQARGFPWSTIAEDADRDQYSPASPFDGAQRDFYLQGTTVDNAAGSQVWWANAYGEHAMAEEFAGGVRQWISTTDTTGYPELERTQRGLADDFGPTGSGVHAPN